ncbi:MAG: ATP-binding protein [Candidatus Thermoplasmatota archaeon]|nr:ATP-binding protein [Candidatus Thermoplasmatota archaeon]
MIISIASGKGGTGKTTIATNLALSLDNVQLIDCDVEEPNANIFLNAKIKERQDVSVNIPEIDKIKCNFCGKCSEFCAYNALAVVPSDVLVFSELCHSCGGCELVCPKDAVGWSERVVGVVEHGVAEGIDFYHGLLNVGEIQAIPVIKALKRKVDKSKNVILDAPPGTSCPVIETVGGSDYCILVTESTPFGLHDLKLAVDVIRHMCIPFGVIINRDGVGDKKVERYCQNEKIPVLMKIPHSEEIAKLYSKGIPFVNELPDWKNEFQHLFSRIQSEVKA